MITLLRSGHYTLIETKHGNKILSLDKDTYAWVRPAEIGEILVVTHKAHKTDYILSMGNYRIYDVDDEPDLSDQMHLELKVNADIWQGYLLLSGLPSEHHKRGRIIPTSETITTNPDYGYAQEELY